MKYLLMVIAVLASACTQQSVSAVYKGENQYGRNNSYTSKTYTDAKPEFFSYKTPGSAPNSSTPATYESSITHSQVATESVTVAPLTPISVNDAAPLHKALPATTEKRSDAAPAGSKQLPLDTVAKKTTASNFIWPAEGKVISLYGSKSGGKFNDGINIAAVEGEPVWAAADGTVIYAGNQLKGYGNMALIQHENEMVSSYAHAEKLLVKKGDHVKQGQMIGYVGRTGGVDTAQLHFSLRQGKTPVNPANYLSQHFASN